MLTLETLVRDSVSWHFSFEDLVLIALDIENSGRWAFLGERQPSRDTANVKLYTLRKTFNITEDIDLVACSCNDEVRRKFLSHKLTTSLGEQVIRWKIDERTKGLRVPVIFFFGCCCRAFDLPLHSLRTDDKDIERFMRYY